MADPGVLVRLHGIGKRYGRGADPVLDGVDAELPGGCITALAGGNGSGKSTLLRIVAGAAPPSSGRVHGRPPSVGYVPERFEPVERMSAAAHLAHLGRIRGLARRQARARAEELLDRLDLVGAGGDGPDTPLNRLSKGNAQKVALAQALLVPVGLLVLDEPWSGLDAAAHGILDALVAETAAAGGAILFTDHGEGAAVRPGRRLRLAGGRLHEHRADGPRVRIRLAPGPAAAPADWAARPGVREAAATSDGGVELRVDPGARDALLLDALRRGWSVPAVADEPAGSTTA